MMLHKICIATTNINKATEIEKILSSSKSNFFKITNLAQLTQKFEAPDENGNTFEDNAMIKARYYYNHLNIPIIADDSGLSIPALNNMPGIFSRRWAKDGTDYQFAKEKIQKELNNKGENMNSISAYFQCSVAYVSDKDNKIFTGIVNGVLDLSRDLGKGFGYDPIFIPEGHRNTFSEMQTNLKNSISHRSIAVRKFLSYLSS